MIWQVKRAPGSRASKPLGISDYTDLASCNPDRNRLPAMRGGAMRLRSPRRCSAGRTMRPHTSRADRFGSGHSRSPAADISHSISNTTPSDPTSG